MEKVAVYYENTIIYWNTIILMLGGLASVFMGASLYFGKSVSKKKQKVLIFIYYPLAIIISLVLSRLLHWYCHMEQYESLKSAMTLKGSGGYHILGVLFGTWLTSWIFSVCRLTDSREKLLDALAPSLAFFIGCVRFSDCFSEICRGKRIVDKAIFKRFPFAIAEGNGDYRLAVFYISFVLLMAVTVILIYLYIRNGQKKAEIRKVLSGDVYRMFIVLYGATEIVTDSMRNDASHLYFPGEALAGLNKGAGFMGLSQLVGAIGCLYVFIFLTVRCARYIKENEDTKSDTVRMIFMWFVYLSGFALAGLSEYFVQRHASMFVRFYSLQGIGVLLMIVMTFMMQHLGTKRIVNGVKNENRTDI